MQELSIKSFAKINLGLNIISKRDDGYHNLQTIFFPIGLYDIITIKKSNYFSFTTNDRELLNDRNNLILKAHKLLEESTGRELICEIHLQKNIPIGAGLGGGSSNAANVLKALNEFFSLEIDSVKLSEIALELGSDVPLFLSKLPAYAESRGEKLYPVKLVVKGFLLVVNPGIHISTKSAFSKIIPKLPEHSLKDLIINSEIKFEEVVKYATNDFEAIVFEELPIIKEIKDRMIQFGSVFSQMTGTGSTVFGFFEDEVTANQAELFFRCKNYFTYLERLS
ncbi:4-(cytidine 5'-diphospho)-2-C-methyl-D-erythritol kinase [Ignavibacterium sp.]|uniref:4-(cytidine 5'-diphospho)-2-C-methyl-D-erythritol kinase n=1 Tax=Ignavibacterium sp. TaxID=2651167 RepID=UPI00307E5985